MKKLVMTVAVLACAASMVSAQVTSANIVGYTKVEAVGGELTLAAVNFDTGGVLLSDVIPSGTLPANSSVYKWDKTTKSYAVSSLNARGAWNNNFTLNLGDALWIQAAGTDTNEIVFSGEVLTDVASITLPNGIVATGYYYPVSQSWTATQMASDLVSGSTVYIWDAGSQSYISASKNARGAWNANPTIDPQSGFWVLNNGAEAVVNESVPFTP
jgi:hypothetical protein